MKYGGRNSAEEAFIVIRGACAVMLLALIPAGGSAQPTDVDALVGGLIFRNGIILPVGSLESLTTAPARQFKQGHITGTIEPGKRADVVFVQGDPATEPGALTRVTRLYRAGKTIYQAPPGATGAAVDRLRAIQQELITAWLAQDRPTIERLLAPDWTVTGPTGAISTRATVLADAFDRRIHRMLSGTISDLTVRMIGTDAAVVAGRTHATGTYDGVAYTADIRFTDVFERHAGDWRAVRSHASSIAK